MKKGICLGNKEACLKVFWQCPANWRQKTTNKVVNSANLSVCPGVFSVNPVNFPVNSQILHPYSANNRRNSANQGECYEDLGYNLADMADGLEDKINLL